MLIHGRSHWLNIGAVMHALAALSLSLCRLFHIWDLEPLVSFEADSETLGLRNLHVIGQLRHGIALWMTTGRADRLLVTACGTSYFDNTTYVVHH